MSAVAMANVALRRRKDYPDADSVRVGSAGVADAAEANAGAGIESSVTTNSPVTSALSAITAYIPTEVLTLYVAGVAVFLSPDEASGSPDYANAWRVFWFFLAFTPIVTWLVYAAKARSANLSLGLKTWPYWEMIAGTIGFAVWAAAFPNTPFADRAWYSSPVAGFAVLLVTSLLALISAVILPPKRPG